MSRFRPLKTRLLFFWLKKTEGCTELRLFLFFYSPPSNLSIDAGFHHPGQIIV